MSALDDIFQLRTIPTLEHKRQARAELAALRSRIAELEAQAATLTPRRCSRECYLRGWQAAQEAAVTVLSDWNLSPYLVGSKFGGDTIPFTIREHLAECVRAMQPPADCGDCNPLKPQSDEVDSDELDEVLAQLNPVVSDYIRETSEHDAVAVDVCGMCKNFNRCESLFGCKPGDTECDWYPSRFERA